MTLVEQIADYAAFLEMPPQAFESLIKAAFPGIKDDAQVYFTKNGYPRWAHIDGSGPHQGVVRYHDLNEYETSARAYFRAAYNAQMNILFLMDERTGS